MDKKPKTFSRLKIDDTANRLIQVVLSILPIAAAITGLLFQQQKGNYFLGIIALIWLSIIVLVISALWNLRVIRFPEAFTHEANELVYKKYMQSLTLFTVGMVILTFSPAGLILNLVISPPPSLSIVVDNPSITATLPLAGQSLHSTAVIRYTGTPVKKINISLSPDSSHCLQVSPDSFDITLNGTENQIIDWTVGFQPNCNPGSYLVLIEAKESGNLLQSSSVSYLLNNK